MFTRVYVSREGFERAKTEGSTTERSEFFGVGPFRLFVMSASVPAYFVILAFPVLAALTTVRLSYARAATASFGSHQFHSPLLVNFFIF